MISVATLRGLKLAMMRHYISLGAYKTAAMFDRQLWTASLGLYRRDIDEYEFIDAMAEAIDNQLNRAWREGAREVGVELADMTDEDDQVIEEIIKNEQDFVLRLAEDILDARRTLDLDQFRARFRPRIDIWAGRYQDVVNRAKLHFGDRDRLEWVYGDTQHCTTCEALNGIVAWAREWDESGVRPQSPPNRLLECGGWRCQCQLVPTDKRRSPKALSLILNVIMRREI